MSERDLQNEREELERAIDMLRYSIENAEQQMSLYPAGELTWTYAKKIADSCREFLAAKEKDLAELDRRAPGGPGR